MNEKRLAELQEASAILEADGATAFQRAANLVGMDAAHGLLVAITRAEHGALEKIQRPLMFNGEVEHELRKSGILRQ